MTEREKMISGGLYWAGDPELAAARLRAKTLCRLINATLGTEEGREELMRALFGSVGQGAWVEPSFYCDYGFNIHMGKGFYANHGCVFLDCAPITIGDDCMLGPRVTLTTATHPLQARRRCGLDGEPALESAAPITIGERVWIGGNAVICPGVTIGPDSVIGAGSVVTRDLPGGVVAAGNPCRVLREITREDRQRWERALAEYRGQMPRD